VRDQIAGQIDRAARLLGPGKLGIDIDTGPIVSGDSTIEKMGEEILDLVIRTASGDVFTRAELKGQSDFIPWKRGVSL